jgi:hypothetical protein
MTRTFLLTIELPIEADVNLVASDIHEELDGLYPVRSVKPWSSHESTTLTPPPIEGAQYLGQDL